MTQVHVFRRREAWLLAAAALLLVAAPLFAGGSKEATGTTGQSAGTAIAPFEEAYPTIKVNWSNAGGGSAEYTKVMTATAAGKGLPDVVMSEHLESPELIEYGSFQPINTWCPSRAT